MSNRRNYTNIDSTYSRKRLGYNPFDDTQYTTRSLFDRNFDNRPLLASIPNYIDRAGEGVGNLAAGTGLIAGAATFAPSLAPLATAVAPLAAAAGVAYGVYKVGKSLDAW